MMASQGPGHTRRTPTMRFLIRLGIPALFAIVIGGAALAGFARGRGDTPRSQGTTEARPAEAETATDQQIAGSLARIQRQPEQPDGYTGLGAAYLQKARESGDPSYYPRAEAALTQALSLDPNNADTLISLGTLALARHQFEAGLDYGE